MALLHERNDRVLAAALQNGHRQFRRSRGFVSMTEAIDHRDEHSVGPLPHQVPIAGLRLPRKGVAGNSALNNGRNAQGRHFFTVTVVPCPGFDVMSNSSINRRTPGKPNPKLPEVEKPSRNA
jgi:hypothetical protein